MIASSVVTRFAARPETASEYDSPFESAPAKIVGLVVTPLTLRVEMSSARLPVVMRFRERSSSQMLTPAAASFSVGAVMRSP